MIPSVVKLLVKSHVNHALAQQGKGGATLDSEICLDLINDLHTTAMQNVLTQCIWVKTGLGTGQQVILYRWIGICTDLNVTPVILAAGPSLTRLGSEGQRWHSRLL